MMAIALLAGILVAGGAFLFYELYLVNLWDRQEALLETKSAIEKLNERAEKLENQNKELEPWRGLSLPADNTFSQFTYDKLLNEMMDKLHFTRIDVKGAPDASNVMTGPSPGKRETPAYKALSFTVKGRGDLKQVVQLLKEFYGTPLLHKIKKLTIRRPMESALTSAHVKGGAGLARKEELDVELIVEAIIVAGAEDRKDLLPKATAHNLARAPSDYLGITGKDPFYPPPPPLQKPDSGPDPARSIKLTMITHDEEDGCKAVLYNEASKSLCYLCPKTGHVRFQIKNSLGQIKVDGEVVQIDEAGRKIVFSADDRLYALPLDSTVADALLRPLSVAQVRALELTLAPGNSGAQ
jgi:hypothetical protein